MSFGRPKFKIPGLINQHFLEISFKFIYNFSSYFVHSQMDKCWLSCNPIGGGNNKLYWDIVCHIFRITVENRKTFKFVFLLNQI